MSSLAAALKLDLSLQPQQIDPYKLYRKWGRQAATVIGFGGAPKHITDRPNTP